MTCYHPLKAAFSGGFHPSGKQKVVILKKHQHAQAHFTVPCQQCFGCRLEYSRQWAVRIHHENSLHSQSCFITLTYDDAHLPGDHSLKKKTFRLLCVLFAIPFDTER